ncbi:MAG TPA: GNAT family N-acetyltransferase [Steroidobacteraceae bacterium]|nr:GNAT family N-acetyltransferase [Steroidobacteraceae bacterium]
MTIIETPRLILRHLTLEDAEFIHGLVNQPSFLEFIGDKGVRTLDDARDYLRKGPIASYEAHGFGLYLTKLKSDGTPIGMCGLVKRDALVDVDVGFAFLPEYWSKGYAIESAAAVLEQGRNAFGLRRIVGIARPDNRGSIRVLEKLGMRFEGRVQIMPEGPEDVLYGIDFAKQRAM